MGAVKENVDPWRCTDETSIPAAVLLDQGLGNGKAEARTGCPACSRGVELLEAPEEAVHLLGWNTGSVDR